MGKYVVIPLGVGWRAEPRRIIPDDVIIIDRGFAGQGGERSRHQKPKATLQRTEKNLEPRKNNGIHTYIQANSALGFPYLISWLVCRE
jgi:hypothetical protein